MNQSQLAFLATGVFALGLSIGHAQSAPTGAASAEIVELSPFTVATDKDTGYQAVDTLSGGRVAVNLLASPSDVTVLTRDFLDDIGAIQMSDINAWLTSAVETDNSGDRDFGNSLSLRGLSVATNLRNYFRYDTSIEGYIMERVESSRGPNAIMYGESNAGGAVGITTKQARARNFGTLEFRTDSYGSLYGALDVNRKLSETLALRFNAFGQDRKSWLDRIQDKRRGAFLTGTYRPWRRTSLRIDLEQTTSDGNAFKRFTDQTSNWDGTTRVTAPLTANPAATTGLARITASTLVVIPTTGRVYDFQNFAQTNGSGLTLGFADARPDGRTPFPVLPSRSFQIMPEQQNNAVRTYYYSAVFDQKIARGLDLQLAADSSSVRRGVTVWDVGGNAVRTDVNQILPDGTANANLGKPYVETRWNLTESDQWQQNYRATLSYDLKLGRNSQLFSVNVLRRNGTFDVTDDRVGRTNGANPDKHAGVNQIGYRFYLDRPGLSVPEPDAIGGYQIGHWLNRDSHNLSTLDSVVLATVGYYFDRKLTVVAGVRTDDAYSRNRSHVDYTPLGDIATTRTFIRDNRHRSKTGGFTYFLIREIGIYGNYSQGFLPIQNESLWVGSRGTINFTVSNVRSIGLRANVRDGFLVGSLGYYTAKEADRNVTSTKTAINNIWTTLAVANPALLDEIIGGPFSSFNDTLDYSAHGYEAEVTMNPSKRLRLMANFALPRTEQDNAFPDTIEYYNRHLAQWQAGLSSPALSAAQKTSLQNNINNVANQVLGSVNHRTINGTVKYRANLFVNYMFAGERLSGLAVGAGVNLFGRQLIGNTQASGFDYVYADSYKLVMAKVSYEFRYRKLPLRAQLTVNNLLDHKDPVYRDVAVVGGTAYRNNYIYVNPLTTSLSVRLSF